MWPGGWSIINSIIPPQHKNGKQNSFSFPHTPSALDLISLSNGFSFKPTSSSSIILIDLVQCECVERWLWMCRKVCRLRVYKGGCETFNKSAATCPLLHLPLPCPTIDPDELNTPKKIIRKFVDDFINNTLYPPVFEMNNYKSVDRIALNCAQHVVWT